jgi:hypothetical protein
MLLVASFHKNDFQVNKVSKLKTTGQQAGQSHTGQKE